MGAGLEFRVGVGSLSLEGVLPFQPLLDAWAWLEARNAQSRQLDAMSDYRISKHCPRESCKAGVLFLSVAVLDNGPWRYCRKCRTHFR